MQDAKKLLQLLLQLLLLLLLLLMRLLLLLLLLPRPTAKYHGDYVQLCRSVCATKSIISLWFSSPMP